MKKDEIIKGIEATKADYVHRINSDKNLDVNAYADLMESIRNCDKKLEEVKRSRTRFEDNDSNSNYNDL